MFKFSHSLTTGMALSLLATGIAYADTSTTAGAQSPAAEQSYTSPYATTSSPYTATDNTRNAGFACQVVASAQAKISSPVQGVLGNVMVERGDTVQKSQPIARLNATVEKAAVALARTRAVSDALLRSKQARLAFEENKLKRNKLLAKKEFVSEIDLDQIRTDRDIAKMEVAQAKDSMKVARMELAQAQAQLNIRTIRSPIDGVVTARLLHPGEQVRNQPIAIIQRVDPLYVEVALPTSLFAEIKPGAKAKIDFAAPGLPQTIAAAKLVDTVIDAPSNTFGVRFVIANKDHTIPAGIKCHLHFLDASDAPHNQ